MNNCVKTILILFVLLSGCAHKPPNIPVCGRLFMGAQCGWTIDGPDFLMTEQEFQHMVPMIFMDLEGWGEIVKFIKRVCARKGACADDWKQRLLSLSLRIGANSVAERHLKNDGATDSSSTVQSDIEDEFTSSSPITNRAF